MNKSNLKIQVLKNINEDDQIDKNSEEYKNLISSLTDLEHIQIDLYNCIKTKNNKIKNINNLKDNLENNLLNSNNNLQLCDKYYHKNEGNQLVAYLKEPLKGSDLNKLLYEKGINLSYLVHRKESLEEQFLELTKTK